MIKATIFDLDGTLVDSNVLHAAAWPHFGKVRELFDKLRKDGRSPLA